MKISATLLYYILGYTKVLVLSVVNIYECILIFLLHWYYSLAVRTNFRIWQSADLSRTTCCSSLLCIHAVLPKIIAICVDRICCHDDNINYFYSALLEVHKQVLKQRDEFYQESERLRQSATPRPDWEKCADVIPGGTAEARMAQSFYCINDLYFKFNEIIYMFKFRAYYWELSPLCQSEENPVFHVSKFQQANSQLFLRYCLPKLL